ncbi:MAG: hypothetical protein R2857_15910 [Vampirovibrionales bacterium]
MTKKRRPLKSHPATTPVPPLHRPDNLGMEHDTEHRQCPQAIHLWPVG